MRMASINRGVKEYCVLTDWYVSITNMTGEGWRGAIREMWTLATVKQIKTNVYR